MAGDPPAELVAFCEREYPRLVGALTLYCGDPWVADELAQDALTSACERWDRVARMAAPGAWVHRVAVNAANSWFRRRAAERRARHRMRGDVHEAANDPDAADAVAVRREIARLPARQAQVVVLRYYLGLTVAEAAGWMACSEASVKSLMHRASTQLSRRLGAHATDHVQEVDDATK